MKKIKLLMILSVAVGLTACGGGSSDEKNSLKVNPVATEMPTVTPVTEPVVEEPTPVVTTQDPVKEDPKPTPVVEEPTKEDPVKEEPVKEDPKPVVEDPKPAEEPKAEKQTGYYIDSAVSGVTYTCGTFTGITGTDGSFSYEKNQDCTFKIGNMVLREVKATTLTVSGLTVVEHNPIAAQLLQTLDSDGDASNGITLLENVASILAENGFDKVLPVGNMDENLKKIAQQLKEKDGEYDGSFKSVKETKLHLQQTITTLKGNGVKTTESLEVVESSVVSIVVEEPVKEEPKPIVEEPNKGDFKQISSFVITGESWIKIGREGKLYQFITNTEQLEDKPTNFVTKCVYQIDGSKECVKTEVSTSHYNITGSGRPIHIEDPVSEDYDFEDNSKGDLPTHYVETNNPETLLFKRTGDTNEWYLYNFNSGQNKYGIIHLDTSSGNIVFVNNKNDFLYYKDDSEDIILYHIGNSYEEPVLTEKGRITKTKLMGPKNDFGVKDGFRGFETSKSLDQVRMKAHSYMNGDIVELMDFTDLNNPKHLGGCGNAPVDSRGWLSYDNNTKETLVQKLNNDEYHIFDIRSKNLTIKNGLIYWIKKVKDKTYVEIYQLP